MTAPTSSSWANISSLESAARQPGIDSSLSRVPPVWPRPRPESWGTATPQAATSGASGRVILSPDAAGRVLVGGRARQRGEVHPLPRRDHRVGPAGDLAQVHAVEQDRHGERRHLLVGDVATGVGVDHPVDLAVGQLGLAVALGADDLDGVVRASRRTVLQVVGAEGLRQHLGHGADALGRLDQRARRRRAPTAAGGSAARHDHVAVAVDAHEVGQPPAAGGVQLTTPGRTRRRASRRTPRSRRCSPRRGGRRRRAPRHRRGSWSRARRRGRMAVTASARSCVQSIGPTMTYDAEGRQVGKQVTTGLTDRRFATHGRPARASFTRYAPPVRGRRDLGGFL